VESDHRKGLLLALLGFAMLSAGDAVIKSIAGAWPGTAIATLRYCIGAVGLGVVLWRAEGRAGFSMPLPWIQIGRAAAVSIASICFFISVFIMPLAVATSITFMSPMLTALFSAVFLKERVPRAAWSATFFAFVGVLIVLRPNVAHLGVAAFLPLICACGMSMLMILNRKAAGAGSALQMQFLIAAIASPILIAFTLIGHATGIAQLHVGVPTASIIARCAFVALTASTSHLLVYLATVRVSAATIAPMTYIQLLVAGLIGSFIFGDHYDLLAIVGATMIVVSGIYLWRRQSLA
jgi:drug/metabolite transporter (DMT)-like permease